MRTIARILLVVLGLCLVVIALYPRAQSGKSSYAFVNVSVIPMDSERILENQTVIVRGDRIVVIGSAPKVKVPQEVIRIDGRGKYLIPGFAEMHGHVPPPDALAAYLDSVLFLYLSNGVTTVRGMLGAPNQLQLRAKANGGEILSPTLYLAGPSFSGNSIDSPAQAEQRVREQKAAGWDLLKVHPGLSREEYDAMARTAREVAIPFAGHVPADVGLLHALERGQQTIDHLDGFIEHLGGDKGPLEENDIFEIADKTRDAQAWVVPTMALWETIIGAADLERLKAYPELKYMPPHIVENWIKNYTDGLKRPDYSSERVRTIAQNRKRLLSVLRQRNVPILFGTDAPQMFSVPGFSIHREIPIMAEARMSPYEILRSGTKSVGEYFKNKDNFGTIEAGKRADLLLLNANPLRDARNIAALSGVMVRGRWLSDQEIQQQLERIAASYQRP